MHTPLTNLNAVNLAVKMAIKIEDLEWNILKVSGCSQRNRWQCAPLWEAKQTKSK